MGARWIRGLGVAGAILGLTCSGATSQTVARPVALPTPTVRSVIGASSRLDAGALLRTGRPSAPDAGGPSSVGPSLESVAHLTHGTDQATTSAAGTSQNWSGYIAGDGPYTSVTGTFRVPHLAATSTVSVASEWVGIDGVAPDRSLIQAGVDELYNPATQRVYTQAWWEILPAPSVPILSLAVSPGDSITVTVRQLAGAQWAISVTDISTGGSFTIEPTYRGPATSAEWIVEAPTDGTTGEEYPLGAYSPPVVFRDLQAAGPETALTRVAMVQGGATVSAPSALTAAGFHVSYVGPAAGGAAPAATPAPAPAPSLRVYTIAPGQSLRLKVTGGIPGLTAEWQVSPDQITWTPLTAVAFDAAGNATTTFAPVATAYYRLYDPSLAQAEPWILEIVVAPAGSAPSSPVPTPSPSSTPPGATPGLAPSPAPVVPTIFTVTAGAPATLTEAGPPNSGFTLQRSPDEQTWTALAQLTTDARGTATYAFTPDATAYYRALFPDGPTEAGVGVVLPPLSAGIVLAAPPVITWGAGATLRVSVGAGGSRAVEILATRDAITWTRIALLTTDTQGAASVTTRPATNAWYRAVVTGAPDLPAATSTAIRIVVRQLALARGAGRVMTVPRGAPVTLSAVLRPDQPGLPVPVATFRILRWTGARWQLVRSIVAAADASGVARLTAAFDTSGSWSVTVMADPTPENTDSAWAAAWRLVVR